MAFSFIAAQIDRDKQNMRKNARREEKRTKDGARNANPSRRILIQRKKENTKDKTNTKKRKRKRILIPPPFEEQVFHYTIIFVSPSLPCMAITEGRRKAIQNLHKKGFGLEEFKQVFEAAQQSRLPKRGKFTKMDRWIRLDDRRNQYCQSVGG